MIRGVSMRQFLSRDITCQNRRISNIIARSRGSMSPSKRQIKSRLDWKTEPPTKIIFPRRSRPSINSDDLLKSDEFIMNLRNRESLDKKLQKMKASIRVNSESESPVKLAKMIPISRRRPSEADEGNSAAISTAEFDRGVSEALVAIRKNFSIFETLFLSARNKLDIVSKLHGWDDSFEDVFFDNRQLRNFTVQTAREGLGLDKRTHKSKNYLNKLKLFLGQLIRVNAQRENLLAEIQKQKIQDEIKEIQSVERHYYTSCKGYQKKSYDKMVKQTREVFDMKIHIKDKNEVLKEIEEQTGGMTKIDNFFRKQAENLAFLETLLVKGEEDLQLL